ncbi:MAG: aspartate--tRNA ligase [Planctomycetota bacterium]
MSSAPASPSAAASTSSRTHTCGDLRTDHVGSDVGLVGWVNSYRDHGTGLVFIDLRDRHGITQVVFDRDDATQELLDAADALRSEDVIRVRGGVRAREGGANPKLETGEIELVAQELEVLNKAVTPPFQPGDEQNLPGEDIRLKHRYLDLRRSDMQRCLLTRHRAGKVARDYFDEHGFVEVETPVLCKSTPEGARDFLVPSRLTPGGWYALPQSPQIFKQLLMVAGMDRYMQIVKCFRDEDLRADRQPEFTQIDLELSFVSRDDVIEVCSGYLRRLWKEVLGYDVPAIDVVSYSDAVERYGIDRPDRRIGLELVDVSDIAAKTDFKVFADALAKRRGVVKAIRVPGGAEKFTRKITDGYTEFVKQFGAGGVPVAKYTGQGDTGGFETGVARFIAGQADALVERLGLEPGDSVLFGADTFATCSKALAELRLKIAKDLDLFPEPGDENYWDFLWVVDFPMFEYDEETQRFYSMHHPFTGPRADHLDAFMNADPSDRDALEGILTDGYDIVVNGSEVGGGSVRIHRQDVQAKVFELLGIGPEEAREKFGFLLDALQYGAPPHAGLAFGFDRLVMHLAGTSNIRDVIAFPKTQTGADLMSDSPSAVDPEQLAELFVKNDGLPEGE